MKSILKHYYFPLFLTIVSFIPMTGKSQCKWKISEKDAFTDEIHLLSKKIVAAGDKSYAAKSYFAHFYLDRSGSDYSLKMEYVEHVLMDKEVNDFVLRIKTSDGLIELDPSTDATFEYNATPLTMVTTSYSLTGEQVEMLKSGISIMGITYSGSDRKFKEGEKDYSKLVEYIKCATEF